MKFTYLDNYFPPIPVLEVILGYPAESMRLGPFVAIIATGADGTLVPQSYLDALNAPFVDDVRIRSHWGEWRNIQTFTVDIGIGSLRLPSIEVLGDDSGVEIVLGRNLLNMLRLQLDGRANQVELFDT